VLHAQKTVAKQNRIIIIKTYLYDIFCFRSKIVCVRGALNRRSRKRWVHLHNVTVTGTPCVRVCPIIRRFRVLFRGKKKKGRDRPYTPHKRDGFYDLVFMGHVTFNHCLHRPPGCNIHSVCMHGCATTCTLISKETVRICVCVAVVVLCSTSLYRFGFPYPIIALCCRAVRCKYIKYQRNYICTRICSHATRSIDKGQ